jgi:hypothetical protein
MIISPMPIVPPSIISRTSKTSGVHRVIWVKRIIVVSRQLPRGSVINVVVNYDAVAAVILLVFDGSFVDVQIVAEIIRGRGSGEYKN